jgi:hypothetical protein
MAVAPRRSGIRSALWLGWGSNFPGKSGGGTPWWVSDPACGRCRRCSHHVIGLLL